jgi:Immunity protein 21
VSLTRHYSGRSPQSLRSLGCSPLNDGALDRQGQSMSARVFANDGGPLIAFDSGDAALWDGGENPDEGSDYRRACETGYPAGLVPLTTSAGVVIGAEEGLGTAWWLHSTDRHLFLVGCAFADDDVDEDLPRLLDDATWTSLVLSSALDDGVVGVFAPAV